MGVSAGGLFAYSKLIDISAIRLSLDCLRWGNCCLFVV